MLRSAKALKKRPILASDGEVGQVDDSYFDDEGWAIRYLVADTGTWLESRKVLISPYSVNTPVPEKGGIHVALTREQVRNSPDIDTHMPVSRQHEREYLGYYGYPTYWNQSGLWALGESPVLNQLLMEEYAERHEQHTPDLKPEDSHLRSVAHVSGYDLQANDDGIGHVVDFLYDNVTWAIRYLVVDISNWWPGSSKVLISTRWIDRIDWNARKVFTSLSSEAVKMSEPYDEFIAIERDFEERLHQAHSRQYYWGS